MLDAALASAHYLPGRQLVLEDATAVEIEPLSSAQITAYLTYRFPDPANPRLIQKRWRPVLTNIASQPQGPLAAALSSPLRLFLAVTAYHNPATTPAELVQLPADDLDRYLLDQLIPAVTAQRPKPNGETYDSGEVTRWLATFADYLQTERSMYGDPAASDIDLHNLWIVAGGRVPLLASTVRGMLAAVPLIVSAVYYRQLVPDLAGSGLPNLYRIPSRLLFAGAAILIASAAWSASQTGVELQRLDLSRLRTTRARLRVATGLAIGLGLGLGLGIGLTGGIFAGLGLGLAVGLAIGIPVGRRYWRANRHRAGLIAGLALAVGPDLFIGYSLWGVGATWLAPTFGLVFGLTAGMTGGLAAGLAWGLTQRPAAISKPSQLVSQGVSNELTLTIAIALSFGVVFSVQWLAGLVSSLWPASSAVEPWIALGNVYKFYGSSLLLFYIPKALLLGLACGIAGSATSPWLRYFITVRILEHKNRLPGNPAAFLDWAYDAGLVRLSGIHAQFRHEELQKHLGAVKPRPFISLAAQATSASINPASLRLPVQPAAREAAGISPLRAASSDTRSRRLLAQSGVLLGALVLATAAAPGVTAPDVGSRYAAQLAAAQAAIPTSASIPAVTANAAPEAVVLAFLDAINHQDWPRVWQLGAKNLNIPYGQMAYSFPRTSDKDVFITSAIGDVVTVLLVAVEAHNQAQVYGGRYVAKNGVITGRVQSLQTTGPSEGLFTGLAGSWYGHGRVLTISSHGLGIAEIRVYQPCTIYRSLPCDSIVSNYMYLGGIIIFQLTHENGNQATGFILGGSLTPAKGPVSITLSVGAIALTTSNHGVQDTFCGPYSLPLYCGA